MFQVNLDGLVEELERRLREELRRTQAVGWMNVDGAARYLATTPDAIRSLVKRNAIPVHRVNGRVLFSPTELDAYVRGRAA